MQCAIYQLVNTKVGKMYIGSTTDARRREYDHFYYLEKGNHPNIRLQNSYNKHGRDAFRFIIIEEVERSELIAREQLWMDSTQCYVDGVGYNIARKATSSPDRHIDEDREMVRRDRIREALVGVKKSPEHIEKIKEHRKGNTGRTGVPHDEASKAKIGKANRGSNNAFTKLDDRQVKEIKQLLRDTNMLQREIGELYSVKQEVISDIKLGKTWKHVKLD